MVLLHDKVAKILPPPQSSIFVSFAVLDACAPTLMPAPVHTPLVGVVIDTVGAAVGVLVPFATVTVRVAVAVPPAESVTFAVSVTEPSGEAFVFQLKPLFVPLYRVVVPVATVYVYPVPLPPAAETETVVVPLTLAPLAGFTKLSVGALGDGEGLDVEVPPSLVAPPAPATFTA